MVCLVRREPHTRALLRLVDQAAGVRDFATAPVGYGKCALVAVGGVEALINAGVVTPLFSFRHRFDSAQNAGCTPGYRLAAHLPLADIDPAMLRVRDGRLVCGATDAETTPFRRGGYALCEVTRTDQRDDIAALPFYPLYERIMREAALTDEDSWLRARANRLALLDSLVQSLDLTPVQATALHALAGAEMLQRRGTAQLAAANGSR
jgi:hypothetical protein